jgi:hypothetical protein
MTKISKEMATRSQRISLEIQPMLRGQGHMVQGAVLADLVAIWLASVQGSDAERVRKELLEQWLETVHKLISPSEQQILERTASEGRG